MSASAVLLDSPRMIAQAREEMCCVVESSTAKPGKCASKQYCLAYA